MEEAQDYELDLNDDGVPDIVVKYTNGHTVYVNVPWAIARVVAAITALASLVGGAVLVWL